MSEDHKPELPAETARIEAAGGVVHPLQMPLFGAGVIEVGPPRVFTRHGEGGLAMSRALGDVCLKLRPFVEGEPLVVATPDVRCETLSAADAFVIIGTDGLWDVTSDEAACAAVAEVLRGGGGSSGAGNVAEAASARLVEDAYAAGSSDNICVIVIAVDPAL